MYQIGDRVVYGIHGVCCIVDQEERIIDRKKVLYLALEPVGQAGSRYLVPTHNAAAMAKLCKLLTAQELEQMIHSPQIMTDAWISDENLRKQTYRELINSGDRIRLLQMISTLYRHKEEQYAAGRKVHLCDDNFLRDAEKLLSGEISYVLGMDADQARSYLRTTLRAE